MKTITQEEALRVFMKVPYPRSGKRVSKHGIINTTRDTLFLMRFMFKLNDLAKSRGYRLFQWWDYMIPSEETDIRGSWILSNIEILSDEIIDKTGATVS